MPLLTLLLLCASAVGELSPQPPLPRPEHPRPDFQRSNWLNLNGSWQFEIDADATLVPAEVKPDRPLAGSIVVPFCPESKLSGVGNTGFMRHVMYRRRFSLPAAMKGKRVLLHFGAVDYDAAVWVNGVKVGEHRGGYTPFCFDVSKQLRDGDNEVFLSVRDKTSGGLQATGKQAHSLKSQGCVYTRTTGIWQTVYLEACGEAWLRQFVLSPDLDGGRLFFQGSVAGTSQGRRLRLTARDAGRIVATDEVAAAWRGTLAVLSIPKPIAWQVGKPHLYDLSIAVVGPDGKVEDEVQSYFGLRKITLEGNRFLINDKPIFQRTILDQGFYPDGIYTAPTDAALRRDVELSMAAGFNGARLHQKVFEPRLLYWADKLGYLLWGEYPSWGLNLADPEAIAQACVEWEEVLARDRNHPAIVGWCPLNETGTSPEIARAQRLLALTQSIDPSRPYLDTSGYCHLYAGTDVYDSHNYNQDPVAFRGQYEVFSLTGKGPFQNRPDGELPYAGQPYFVSEYGGTKMGGQEGRDKAWGYGSAAANVDEFLARYKGLTDALLDNPNMFGFCYTQLTDIEQEQNGVYYYDRRPKYDPARLKAINARAAAYETQPPRLGELKRESLVPTSEQSPQRWRYTLDRPAEGWQQAGFDDRHWAEAPGGFGRKDTPGAVIATPWLANDIWLRKEFASAAGGRLMLRLHHDEDVEVHLNGKRIFAAAGHVGRYVSVPLPDAAAAALVEGKNVLAVHCRQTHGGQFIDVGLERLTITPPAR